MKMHTLNMKLKNKEKIENNKLGELKIEKREKNNIKKKCKLLLELL